jgi:hypothetical protein
MEKIPTTHPLHISLELLAHFPMFHSSPLASLCARMLATFTSNKRFMIIDIGQMSQEGDTAERGKPRTLLSLPSIGFLSVAKVPDGVV